MPIPKVLHYTFGMAKDFGGRPWSLVHHACVKSAVDRIKPDQVFFYCEHEPTGPWWALSRHLVRIVRIEAPQEIFGRPLAHVAHRSDVVRLQKLIEHGGIYLDADVLVQNSFDDLLECSTVLGQEGEDAIFGTANAVILAEPNAPFIVRWLDAYRTFRGTSEGHLWNEHSVRIPAKLSKQYPDEITVLPHTAFFWPLWTEAHLHWMFRSTQPIPLAGCYANHLYESKSWKFLADLTPAQVRARDSNFHHWIRPLIADLPDDYGIPPLTRRLNRRARKAVDQVEWFGTRVQGKIRRAVRRVRYAVANERERRRRTFQDVYSRNLWGADGVSAFYSGVGSRGAPVETYVHRMAELLHGHILDLGSSVTIVDLGCGDFRVGRALLAQLPSVAYIGCDIVPELIDYNSDVFAEERVSFKYVDIVSDALPEGDVCLVRQVLQHLSNAEIARVLMRLRYKYVYVTEGHPVERVGEVNPDKVAGADVRFDWRTGRGRGVELDKPPFNLSTQEVLRVRASPFEVIATERVFFTAVDGLVPERPSGIGIG